MSEHLPVAERVVVLHGDYRYGNFLFDGGRITGILDWELAHLGDPAEDLMWPFRPFRRREAPFVDMRLFLERYEEITGYPISRDQFIFYRLLSELKSAVIYLTGARAFVGGGTIDLQLANASFAVMYNTRQMLYWIDEVADRRRP